jgi:hypothetical protein
MAYSQLVYVTPEDWLTRLANIEAYLQGNAGVSARGTHYYAGEYVPLTATTGTDTVGVATQVWIGELRIGSNTLVTGISYLIGTVGGTDKAIAILYDSNGNVLATSALAGVTVGTAATMQRLPFITAYAAGPGLYYVGISTNGTTARLRTQAFGDTNSTAQTAQTFGTITAITVPSTFTASNAPIAMTY